MKATTLTGANIPGNRPSPRNSVLALPMLVEGGWTALFAYSPPPFFFYFFCDFPVYAPFGGNRGCAHKRPPTKWVAFWAEKPLSFRRLWRPRRGKCFAPLALIPQPPPGPCNRSLITKKQPHLVKALPATCGFPWSRTASGALKQIHPIR